MQIIESGISPFKFTDPDEMREWVRDKKPRSLESKLMTEQEAIEKFVRDGDYLAFDLAVLVRGPSSLEREIVRQRKKNVFGGEVLLLGLCPSHCGGMRDQNRLWLHGWRGFALQGN